MLKPSQHLQTVVKKLEQRGYKCDIQQVSYELQRGGTEMLKITRPEAYE